MCVRSPRYPKISYCYHIKCWWAKNTYNFNLALHARQSTLTNQIISILKNTIWMRYSFIYFFCLRTICLCEFCGSVFPEVQACTFTYFYLVTQTTKLRRSFCSLCFASFALIHHQDVGIARASSLSQHRLCVRRSSYIISRADVICKYFVLWRIR